MSGSPITFKGQHPSINALILGINIILIYYLCAIAIYPIYFGIIS